MATDVQPRRSTSKIETGLQQQFAGLCARVRRVDALNSVLIMTLTVAVYAVAMGAFDFFAGNARAAWIGVLRWAAYVGFVGSTALLLIRCVRLAFRPVSPYYVANQIERTLPHAKNSLINWLDLHDQELPTAFRKTLSANAADLFAECDPTQTVSTRRNWVLLGAHALPVLALLLLLLLGPSALFASMMRAFLPFLGTEPVTRTQITLVQPTPANAEMVAGKAVAFAARIDGRVPVGPRGDAPRLLYRYQADDGYLTQPLVPDEGMWTTQLLAEQLRAGVLYKIAAGDAETPEHQIRVRTRAHVIQWEIAYLHRPYRKLARRTAVFPNQQATAPFIEGPRGSDVEVVVRASRPVRQATIEVLTKKGKEEPTVRKVPDDPQAFACRWTLDQPGQFRVLFTATDGEENGDREAYDINVVNDAPPTVLLLKPAQKVELPENGTLVIEGRATSAFGVRGLALHLRIAKGPAYKLQPKIYRPDADFKIGNVSLAEVTPAEKNAGLYTDMIDYMDYIALDELKDEKGIIRRLAPGTILEYWLEATDASDYPSPSGAIGKSMPVHQLTLLPAADAKQQRAKRELAKDHQKKHEKTQDDRLKKEKTEQQDKKGAGGSKDTGPNQDNQDKDLNNKKDQLKKGLDKEDQKKQDQGNSKGAGQDHADSKPPPQGSPEGPQPQDKSQPPMSPQEAGNSKDQGDQKGSSGEAKDGGVEKKDGPPSKDGPPQQGGVKGIEQEGPNSASKDTDPKLDPSNQPAPQAKGSGPSDPKAKPGDDKKGPPEQAKDAGASRGDDKKDAKREPNLDDLAKLIEQLPKSDAAAAELADIAKNARDEAMRELAKDVLDKNNRDPATGKKNDTNTKDGNDPKVDSKSSSKNDKGKEEVKRPSTVGQGKFKGMRDEGEVAAANREFLRRIGQMQLTDWKKRMTPDLLKRVGMNEAEWERFQKDMQAYDARVRETNARLARNAKRKDSERPVVGGNSSTMERTETTQSDLQAGVPLPPPDLRDAQKRFTNPKEP